MTMMDVGADAKPGSAADGWDGQAATVADGNQSSFGRGGCSLNAHVGDSSSSADTPPSVWLGVDGPSRSTAPLHRMPSSLSGRSCSPSVASSLVNERASSPRRSSPPPFRSRQLTEGAVSSMASSSPMPPSSLSSISPPTSSPPHRHPSAHGSSSPPEHDGKPGYSASWANALGPTEHAGSGPSRPQSHSPGVPDQDHLFHRHGPLTANAPPPSLKRLHSFGLDAKSPSSAPQFGPAAGIGSRLDAVGAGTRDPFLGYSDLMGASIRGARDGAGMPSWAAKELFSGGAGQPPAGSLQPNGLAPGRSEGAASGGHPPNGFGVPNTNSLSPHVEPFSPTRQPAEVDRSGVSEGKGSSGGDATVRDPFSVERPFFASPPMVEHHQHQHHHQHHQQHQQPLRAQALALQQQANMREREREQKEREHGRDLRGGPPQLNPLLGLAPDYPYPPVINPTLLTPQQQQQLMQQHHHHHQMRDAQLSQFGAGQPQGQPPPPPQQQSQASSGGPSGPLPPEEITTVFIVGFPDDMTEREFNNMFLFAPGFEAATLKIPAGNNPPAGLAGKTEGAAPGSGPAPMGGIGGAYNLVNVRVPGAPLDIGSLSATVGPGGTSQGWDEASAALAVALGRNGGPAGVDSLSSLLGGLGSGAGGPQPNSSGPGAKTKQIIGFAKFRTRDEALAARDALNGKRVDSDRGCVLKTEMAKKNLHTKQRPLPLTASLNPALPPPGSGLSVLDGGMGGPPPPPPPPGADKLLPLGVGPPQSPSHIHPIYERERDGRLVGGGPPGGPMPPGMPSLDSYGFGSGGSGGPVPGGFPQQQQQQSQQQQQQEQQQGGPPPDMYHQHQQHLGHHFPHPGGPGPSLGLEGSATGLLSPPDSLGHGTSADAFGLGRSGSAGLSPAPGHRSLSNAPSNSSLASRSSSNVRGNEQQQQQQQQQHGYHQQQWTFGPGPLDYFVRDLPPPPAAASIPLTSSFWQEEHQHRSAKSSLDSGATSSSRGSPPETPATSVARGDTGNSDSEATPTATPGAMPKPEDLQQQQQQQHRGPGSQSGSSPPWDASRAFVMIPPTSSAAATTTAQRQAQPTANISSRLGGLSLNTAASNAVPISGSGGGCPPAGSGGGDGGAGATVPTGAGGLPSPTSLPSPGLPSPTWASRTNNPADQNPPGTTLFVGNLPSNVAGQTVVQLEDGLRALFGRCVGFRQLCFRQKGNGPMCFVEFDDVQHATMALNDLYGHTLGGLVKGGGIRLSYSKNPLGVRSNSIPGPLNNANNLPPVTLPQPAHAQSSSYLQTGAPPPPGPNCIVSLQPTPAGQPSTFPFGPMSASKVQTPRSGPSGFNMAPSMPAAQLQQQRQGTASTPPFGLPSAPADSDGRTGTPGAPPGFPPFGDGPAGLPSTFPPGLTAEQSRSTSVAPPARSTAPSGQAQGPTPTLRDGGFQPFAAIGA